MPVLLLSPQEEEEAMKAGGTELKALFARNLVSNKIQALFFHSGVLTTAGLSNFAKDENDLRQCLKDDFGVDASTSLVQRTQVGATISAFQSALTKRSELAKFSGELDARQMQKPLLGSEYLVLKSAFERIHGKQEDCDLPSKSYLERRIADLESGDFRPEALTSIISRDQDEDDSLIQTWDASGQMRLRKSIATSEPPANPEELRKRLNMMIALQHTNREEIQGFVPTFVYVYTNYLLGEHVWQMVARDNDGNTIATPHWNLVLQYEQAIRKKAYSEMQETGTRLHICIKQAWLDPLVKERAFTTPLALSTAAGKHVSPSSNTGNLRNAGVVQTIQKSKGGGRGKAEGSQKGRGRGKGTKGKPKAGGKGSGLTVPTGCAARTPDGRALCFGYNDLAVRCRLATCPFLHVCGICFAKGHPMYACRGQKGAPPAGETQGTGI